MTDPAREEWAKIVNELEAAGVTPYTTAKRMGVQFVQAQRLHALCKAGGEPRDRAARWLRNLHAEHVPQSRFKSPLLNSDEQVDTNHPTENADAATGL